jgi:hypothetical protein
MQTGAPRISGHLIHVAAQQQAAEACKIKKRVGQKAPFKTQNIRTIRVRFRCAVTAKDSVDKEVWN